MAIARSISLPKWTLILLALLSGCMHERHEAIPVDAALQTEGQRELTFRATEPGTVYVYNRNDDKMVYSGEMRGGETLAIDPTQDRVTLGGRTVLDKGLDRNDTLRIFFKPSVIRSEHVVQEREVRTTTETPAPR